MCDEKSLACRSVAVVFVTFLVLLPTVCVVLLLGSDPIELAAIPVPLTERSRTISTLRSSSSYSGSNEVSSRAEVSAGHDLLPSSANEPSRWWSTRSLLAVMSWDRARNKHGLLSALNPSGNGGRFRGRSQGGTSLAASQLPSVMRIPTSTINRVHEAAYLFLILMLLVCYYQTVFTPAGGAACWWTERPDLILVQSNPLDAAHYAESGDVEAQLSLTDASGATRNCKRCRAQKPPRVHHCRVCDECVLRMDHHCVWVGRCIGMRNHKSFILFLFYVVLGTSHAVLLMLRFVIHLGVAPRDSGVVDAMVHIRLPWFVILMTFSAMIALGALMGCGLLLSWQVYIAVRNLTSVEYHKILVGTQSDNPYDRGVLRNLQHLLGRRPWLWLVPVRDRSAKPHPL